MACIDAKHKISKKRQCELLGIPHSSYYFKPKGESELNQIIEALIKEKHGLHPELGSPKMTQEINKEGFSVNHKRVERLMKKNGLYSLLPGPKLTKRNLAHEVYPYALKGCRDFRPNEVWSTDITYLRLPQGHLYLVAIIDWGSRKILSWRMSNTMDVHFCMEALSEALDRYGAPVVFNTDQGSQFTSKVFTDTLLENGILVSMDGKGRAVDNVFIERFWWTIKYEDLFLKGYESVTALKQGIRSFVKYYNNQRLHESLNYEVPELIYSQNRKEYGRKKVA